MASYATPAEFRQFAHEPDEGAEGTDLYTPLLERASRAFDRMCEVADDHFAAAGAAASARTFYGDGTDYLPVDAYTGSLTVAMPSGYVVPGYVVKNGSLVRTYGDNAIRSSAYTGSYYGSFGDEFWDSVGWPAGIPVTVTAVWGESGVPPEVTQAVIALAIQWWRTTDPAAAKTFDIETTREDAPAYTKMIAERFKRVEVAFA